jgi:hypothetical protein
MYMSAKKFTTTPRNLSTSSRYYSQDRKDINIYKMKQNIHRFRYLSIAASIAAVVFFVTTVLAIHRLGTIEKELQNNTFFNSTRIMGLENTVEEQDGEIKSYQDDIVTVVNAYNSLYNDFVGMSQANAELLNQNSEIVNQTNTDNSELEDLRHRAELYDKYDYAIINSMDKNLPDEDRRTDITYDQIDTLESLAAQNGLSDDAVALVLAIAMNESRGQEDSKNPGSTATGYCGILDFTGKYLYEDIMGNPTGSYSHDMCYNGYINLELSLQYIKYLNKMYGGDIMRIVDGYRGYRDAVYDSQLDANLQKAGKSLYTLNLGGG